MEIREPSKVIICRGARATERRLLLEMARHRPRLPEELEPPVRVVVPSRSLRLHLLRQLVESYGAVAGIIVQTLGGLANEIFERTGRSNPARPMSFDLVVRRLARHEEVLASELDALSDGYDTILGAVRDLVDAGFSQHHEDGLLEKIDELGEAVPGSNRRRAAALVRVAARALDRADETGAHPRAAGYRMAAEAIAEQGSEILPARCLLIHGFADLTGVAADLLTATVAAVGGVVLLDRVPDPAAPDADDPGNVFLDRLELRLGGLRRETDSTSSEAPEIEFTEAVDAEAEARWVAERVRATIATGIRPEDIGIVAGRLDRSALSLRRQLGRLGVPFSGVDLRVPGGRLRRMARRLAELLRRGGDAGLDLWVEASHGLGDEVALLLGLRVLSLARVRDLAALAPDDRRLVRGVPLPLADGVPVAGDQDLGRGRSPRLSASRVAAAAARAQKLLETLDGWPTTAAASRHREHTDRLLLALGWDATDRDMDELVEAIAELGSEFPHAMKLDAAEWFSALVSCLDGLGEVPIGGRGGGVQLLTVTEARARTFDHLVICGLNRGEFPRQVVDDAMLPDLVRARVASDVLPEMPVKARSADEERYLFAQLTSAAPVVELCWRLRDDGRRTAPSPFVDRLRMGGESPPPAAAPGVWAHRLRRAGPRPAYEHAVLAATAGADDVLIDLMTRAVAEGRHDLVAAQEAIPTATLASARLDVVRAVERAPSSTDVGPWSGFVGAAVEPGNRLWVTAVEDMATCPLRALIGRRLGVRPLPDPHLGLPDPDRRLVGIVVHEVLERIVADDDRSGRLGLVEALEKNPFQVLWPSEDRVDRLVEEVSRRVIYEEGLGGFGLVRLLTAQARPFLDVARDVEWGDGTALDGVLAAEIEGELPSATGARLIAFRADRLDAGPTATDYKTGKPLSKAKTPETRARHLLTAIRSGRVLQAAAYAIASSSGTGAGRYVYLRPDIGGTPSEARVLEARGDDEELRAGFRDAVASVEQALLAGVGFPRLREPAVDKDPDHCRFCSVSEACRRDDSQFVRQLVELMEGDDPEAAVPVASARRLWWLGVEREETR